MTESYLALSDFSGGVANTGKFRRHFVPLAEQGEITLVCLESGVSVEGITYQTVPSFGFRPLDLLLLFAIALIEGVRNDYDGVLSISLVPYGCFALAVGRLYGLPVHLGIIGADVDVHAQACYSSVVNLLLRRFDAISVPGTEYERQLEQIGIPTERIAILTNAIDIGTYQPTNGAPTEYDCIWVGRFTSEKDPLLFIEMMAELSQQGEPPPHAVMLGSGPLQPDVKDRIQTYGLEDYIELPGWVDEPVDYYHRSRIFVLTSERDALPLTLLEAMATGLACVVTGVGNVPDVVNDGENGIIANTRNAESLAAEIRRLQTDSDLYERVAANAPAAGSRFSYESAEEDWSKILDALHSA
jgi:glycosyltransferase involved in cell wall biosynthesis